MTPTPSKASLNIEMPGVDFAGMAREAIAAKLTEALIGADEAITSIVATALTTKVNEHGVVDRSSYSNKTPFAEWLAQDLIQKAAVQSIRNRVEALRPALEAQVERQLAKNVKSIASALTANFIEQAAKGYGVKFEVTATMNHEPR